MTRVSFDNYKFDLFGLKRLKLLYKLISPLLRDSPLIQVYHRLPR